MKAETRVIVEGEVKAELHELFYHICQQAPKVEEVTLDPAGSGRSLAIFSFIIKTNCKSKASALDLARRLLHLTEEARKEHPKMMRPNIVPISGNVGLTLEKREDGCTLRLAYLSGRWVSAGALLQFRKGERIIRLRYINKQPSPFPLDREGRIMISGESHETEYKGVD